MILHRGFSHLARLIYLQDVIRTVASHKSYFLAGPIISVYFFSPFAKTLFCKNIARGRCDWIGYLLF